MLGFCGMMFASIPRIICCGNHSKSDSFICLFAAFLGSISYSGMNSLNHFDRVIGTISFFKANCLKEVLDPLNSLYNRIDFALLYPSVFLNIKCFVFIRLRVFSFIRLRVYSPLQSPMLLIPLKMVSHPRLERGSSTPQM